MKRSSDHPEKNSLEVNRFQSDKSIWKAEAICSGAGELENEKDAFAFSIWKIVQL